MLRDSHLPEFNPPGWMRDFVRDEVRPLLLRAKRTALAALERWEAAQDEQVQQRRKYDRNALRLRKRGKQRDKVRLILGEKPHVDENPLEHLIDSYDEISQRHGAALERDSTDECWVGLLALHDEVYDPKYRIGPVLCEQFGSRGKLLSIENGYFSCACNSVSQLTEKHLNGLRTMVRTAQESLDPTPSENNGTRLLPGPNKPNKKPNSSPPKQPERIGILLAALKNTKNKHKSKTEIAMQVAEDNDKLAESLLSQARRYERQLKEWRTQTEQS